MQILEMTSNIILRLFCHLKACLKRFQRAYRAQILCEELKLKKYSHFITSLEAIGVLFFHSRPFEAVLSFKSLFELVLGTLGLIFCVKS